MSKSRVIAIALTILTTVSVSDCYAESPNAKKKSRAEAAKGQAKTKPTDKSLKRGSELFRSNCASCHPGGRNKISRSKPIIGSWTLSALSTFKSYLEQPVGTMPHYEHIITDEKNLELLYKYVKTLEPSPSDSKPKSK